MAIKRSFFPKSYNFFVEFAISLVLVISCEPVNVENENRNFSALEAQRLYRWQLELFFYEKTDVPPPF